MPPSPYDSIAGMYHALWFDWYLPAAMPALEQLFFSAVPSSSEVLDLCCGSGHVTKELVKRGYQVTGIDNSADLIALAQQQLPAIEFQVQDICSLTVPRLYDAALSTFDSLNHILTLDHLTVAFRRIHAALRRGGRFVFDMNLDEAYTIDLKQWAVDVHDNSVGLVRGNYDPATQRAKTELMWFSRSSHDPSCWQQRHSIVEQQCYPQEDVTSALRQAGFAKIQVSKATDLGVDANLGYGRIFVAAQA